MDEIFDKIMDFFTLSEEEKEKKIMEMFDLSVQFLNTYKQVLSHGNPEEIEEMTQKMHFFQSKMVREIKWICAQTGLRPEELDEYVKNPANFTQNQWDKISSATKEMDAESTQIAKLLIPGKKELKRKKGKKKPWIKS